MRPKPPTSEPVELAPGLHLTPEGALWLPAEGLVAVADTHFGYDAHQRHSGHLVPEFGTDVLLDAVDALLARYEPAVFLVNGDVKHAFTRNLLEEKEDLRRFEALVTAAGVRLVPVRGNHDAHLERLLEAPVVAQHRAGGCLFAHGHARVARRSGETLVLGHEHPALNLRDEVGVGIRLRAALHHPEERFLVLPALSPWAAGQDPSSKGHFFGPNLADVSPDGFDAYALQHGDVYPFGNLGRLRKLLR